MQSYVRFGLVLFVLPLLGCPLKKPVPDGGVVDASVADAGDTSVADAGDQTQDAAPPLDAGPTTATTAAVPTHVGLVGTFEGSVKEANIHYGMTAVLADKTGTISYSPPFDCKGTWTFESHDAASKTWKYKEHITVQTGKRKCADGETAVIVEQSATVFTYSEGSAHATLSKH